MNEMAAKFAREAKDRPTDWQIYPIGNGLYRLVYLKRGKINER